MTFIHSIFISTISKPKKKIPFNFPPESYTLRLISWGIHPDNFCKVHEEKRPIDCINLSSHFEQLSRHPGRISIESEVARLMAAGVEGIKCWASRSLIYCYLWKMSLVISFSCLVRGPRGWNHWDRAGEMSALIGVLSCIHSELLEKGVRFSWFWGTRGVEFDWGEYYWQWR